MPEGERLRTTGLQGAPVIIRWRASASKRFENSLVTAAESSPAKSHSHVWMKHREREREETLLGGFLGVADGLQPHLPLRHPITFRMSWNV